MIAKTATSPECIGPEPTGRSRSQMSVWREPPTLGAQRSRDSADVQSRHATSLIPWLNLTFGQLDSTFRLTVRLDPF
jgi:hypothetical protein